MERRAKIVATLGPATSSDQQIRKLMRAGLDIVRLNLSHGTADEHRESLSRVRAAADDLGRFVPVVFDLMGPRYRLGQIEAPRRLKRGNRLSLGPEGTDVDIPVSPREILKHLKPGERILIDNGLVELKIESKRSDRAIARVVNGGPIATRKGINMPDTDLPFSISEKDSRDLEMAVELKVDFLAASYVGRGMDLDKIRERVRELGGNIPLIAKLEQGRALEHIDEIAAASDALMVARGDLGVEVPLHRVPVLQKRIIDAGRKLGRPVIVATQMLESMIDQPRPTRAESSDVANAVFDGADALMLSGETSIGRYPIEVVRTMGRIIREAEDYENERTHQTNAPSLEIVPSGPTLRPAAGELSRGGGLSEFARADTIAAAAVFAAEGLKARQIIAFSQGGFTARLAARYRPSSPILAFTNNPQTARRIQLIWGVRPFLLKSKLSDQNAIVRQVERALRDARMAKKGDRIVLLLGEPISEKPLTNVMRIHRIGQ